LVESEKLDSIGILLKRREVEALTELDTCLILLLGQNFLPVSRCWELEAGMINLGIWERVKPVRV